MSLASLTEEDMQARIIPCLRRVKDLKKLRSGEPAVMTFSKFLHFFNPKLFPIYDNAVVRNRVFIAFHEDWMGFCSRSGLDPETTGVDLYANYMRWAAELLAGADSRLADTFAAWFSSRIESSEDSLDVFGELRVYQATAFEFIAIGAALLEEDKGAIAPPRKAFGDYVVSDPSICHGKLTFAGTRVLVSDVLDMVADNADWDDIIKQYHGGMAKEAIAEAVRLSAQALLDHADDYAAAPIPA